MADQTTWRELYRADDAHRIHSIATSIAAMEFNVRLRDARTGTALDAETPWGDGPFAIDVHDEDWHSLSAVLDQIIDEQEAFDQSLENKDEAEHRFNRTILLVILVLVASWLAWWGLSRGLELEEG